MKDEYNYFLYDDTKSQDLINIEAGKYRIIKVNDFEIFPFVERRTGVEKYPRMCFRYNPITNEELITFLNSDKVYEERIVLDFGEAYELNSMLITNIEGKSFDTLISIKFIEGER